MNRVSSQHGRVVAAGLLAFASLAVVSHAIAAPTAASDAIAVDSPGSTASVATTTPTWTALYLKYLAKDTVGDCASCHVEAETPDGAYAWLAQQQYMSGATPYLVDLKASCFSWLGGDMPPDGPSSYPRARREFESWANAGARE